MSEKEASEPVPAAPAENRNGAPAAEGARIRPPLARLPGVKVETRTKSAGPDIYLSWDGETYGPCTGEDVLAGLRAASFDEFTYFWFEGQAEWRQVEEFPGVYGALTVAEKPRPMPTDVSLDVSPDEVPGYKPPPKARRADKNRVPRPPRNYGYLVVLAFVFLAVGLTVGLIYLASRF